MLVQGSTPSIQTNRYHPAREFDEAEFIFPVRVPHPQAEPSAPEGAEDVAISSTAATRKKGRRWSLSTLLIWDCPEFIEAFPQ